MKPIIYLDTSVMSYLYQKDALEREEQTIEFWNILKTGKYQVIIGSIAFDEIEQCDEEKRDIIYQYLAEISYNRTSVNAEIEALAKEIIEEGVLKEKSLDDCLHIATAILSNCNFIVSWNFKHLVNVKTINGIRQITLAKNYNRFMDIYSPNMLLEGDDENE
ncbi:MAG: PIN domain-containing protein [Oscillospiraceae bacterium]|nr:PIN domain-containing protein [Oscillospiraceae bacterium]